jgi:hypothetical protein
MSYSFVIDSHAWIEYFKGSKRGFPVRNYVEEEIARLAGEIDVERKKMVRDWG